MGREPSRIGPRKRIRKRKRRAVSSSESSSSESSDSDTPDKSLQKQPSPPKERIPETSEPDSSSDTDSDTSQEFPPAAPDAIVVDRPTKTFASKRQSLSPSPPPPPKIPSFIPSANTTENNAQKDQVLKDRFRKFWMASVADGFKDDLEEIRKEPNLNTMRLALLIDSLASGADVFAPSPHQEGGGINEMELLLDQN